MQQYDCYVILIFKSKCFLFNQIIANILLTKMINSTTIVLSSYRAYLSANS